MPRALDRAVSEAELQDTLIQAFDVFGWVVFHDNDSRRNRCGFPDLVAAHERAGVIAFLELKSARGQLRPQQKVWLAALEAAARRIPNLWVDVIRPQHLDLALNRIRHLSRPA